MTESITTIAIRPPRRHRSTEEAAALVADCQASGQNTCHGIRPMKPLYPSRPESALSAALETAERSARG